MPLSQMNRFIPSSLPFNNQKYKELRKTLQADCKLFSDTHFPANDKALAYDVAPYVNVEWRRPTQLVEDPCLFTEEGPTTTSVIQGSMKSSWFASACSILVHKPDLLAKVVPDPKDQEWSEERPELYCGMFHFCIWQFGQWVDIVIDDLLPTQNGKLIFCRSRNENEFWSALLEKAYAKFYGCYEALTCGSLSDCFMDLTGGIPEAYDLAEKKLSSSAGARGALFEEMIKASNANSFMGVYIRTGSETEAEQTLTNGLVKDQWYSVTDVRRLDIDGDFSKLDKMVRVPDKVLMIRLRNPWSTKEWNGPWSDGAREWECISYNQREQINLKFEDDGEFWMSFDDFSEHFHDLVICHQMNTSYFSFQSKFYEQCFYGAWVTLHTKGHLSNRAGGSIHYSKTFWQNPQYIFDVPENFCGNIMINMLQKDVRENRATDATYASMGVYVMRVEDNRKHRIHLPQEIVASHEHEANRSVLLRVQEPKPGRYVVLPTLNIPGIEADFLIRFYSQTCVNVQILKYDLPTEGRFRCFGSKLPLSVTRLKILYARDLVLPVETSDAWRFAKSLGGTAANPYCTVECEGQKARTVTCKDTLDPEWNASFVFFRYNPGKPLYVTIYSYNKVKDTFLGMAVIDATITNGIEMRSQQLVAKDASLEPPPGTLLVEVETYSDPLFL